MDLGKSPIGGAGGHSSNNGSVESWVVSEGGEDESLIPYIALQDRVPLNEAGMTAALGLNNFKNFDGKPNVNFTDKSAKGYFLHFFFLQYIHTFLNQ